MAQSRPALDFFRAANDLNIPFLCRPFGQHRVRTAEREEGSAFTTDAYVFWGNLARSLTSSDGWLMPQGRFYDTLLYRDWRRDHHNKTDFVANSFNSFLMKLLLYVPHCR